MTSVGLDVGSLLIGSYVNLALYTLELVGGYYYFFESKRSKRDRRTLKLAVAVNIFLDLIGTFCGCAITFMFAVIFWGNSHAIFKTYWPITLWLVTSGISAFIVQAFMLRRYWRLSQNVYISFFIFLLMILTFVGIIYVVVISTTEGTFRARVTHIKWIIVTLSASLASDLAITIVLVWQLLNVKTYSRQTQKLVKKLSSQAIKTGAVTCVFAVAVLIAHLVNPYSRVSTALAFLLGRIYTLTMLFTLIYRDKLVVQIQVDHFIHRDVDTSIRSVGTDTSSAGPATPSTARFKPFARTYSRHERNSTHLPSPIGAELGQDGEGSPGIQKFFSAQKDIDITYYPPSRHRSEPEIYEV
ncbi:hypothetical protein B0H34DRAFT_292542 [Crassisporium funariophilum]|nr:hypothetical protein B0H34DRAFT_292542 [Crassisporium funariophilum]